MTEQSIDCGAIGMRIRRLREEHGMTREQLSEQLDISTKFLYEVEMGKYSFNIRILIRLSEIFCVSTDYLLFGKAKQAGKPQEAVCSEAVEAERERFRYMLKELLNL